MSLRIPRPLSPVDGCPAQAALASSVPVHCMHPNARARDWAASQARSNDTNSALHYPSLPLCAGLYSDAAGRELAPFAVTVDADSYRHALLTQSKQRKAADSSDAVAAAAAARSASAPHLSADGRSYAPPALHSPSLLSPADLCLLRDSLLCNTSLTSLSLDRCLLGSSPGTLAPLTDMLQQHPSLVSISLAGNGLGRAAPDSEEIRRLFQTLASKATLPHLTTLNLADKSDSTRTPQCERTNNRTRSSAHSDHSALVCCLR